MMTASKAADAFVAAASTETLLGMLASVRAKVRTGARDRLAQLIEAELRRRRQ